MNEKYFAFDGLTCDAAVLERAETTALGLFLNLHLTLGEMIVVTSVMSRRGIVTANLLARDPTEFDVLAPPSFNEKGTA